MNRVSKNCSWGDAIRSDTAKRNGILNYFTPDQLTRMTTLAEKVYEPLVKHFNCTIYISSFFRNEKVNELIGGAKTSQHMANNGAAMDLDAEGSNDDITNQQIFDYIKDNLDFDQLIGEGFINNNMSWVHCSYVSETKNRHEILLMEVINGESKYYTYDSSKGLDIRSYR
jgi:zinc D-Ala-D-Ala carboxypeptidase